MNKVRTKWFEYTPIAIDGVTGYWARALDIEPEVKATLGGEYYIYRYVSKSEVEGYPVISFDSAFKSMPGYNTTSKCLILNLDGVEIDNVLDMNNMFKYSLFNHIISENFDNKRVKYMKGMFNQCTRLGIVDLEGFNSGEATELDSLFEGCLHLKEVGFDWKSTKNVRSIRNMFGLCKMLKLDIYKLDYSHVTRMDSAFYECDRLANKEVDLGKMNLAKLVSAHETFTNTGIRRAILEIPEENENCIDLGKIFSNCEELTEVTVKGVVHASELHGAFYHCGKLERADLRGLDTSNVGSMSRLFDECTSLKYVNLLDWETYRCVDFSRMFAGCGLTEIDLRNFNFSSAKHLTFMMAYCYNLEHVTFPETCYKDGIRFSGLFAQSPKIEYINTAFIRCMADSVNNMFVNNERLKMIDLRGMTGSIHTDAEHIMLGCDNVEMIIVDGSLIENVKSRDTKVIELEYTSDYELDKQIYRLMKMTSMGAQEGQEGSERVILSLIRKANKKEQALENEPQRVE